MKLLSTIWQFLWQVWMMVFILFFAGIAFLGATRVIPIVWVLFGIIAVASVWAAVKTKRMIWLAVAPVFALPLFLLGGLQESMTPEQAHDSSAAKPTEQRTVQDVARKISSMPFGN